MGICMCKAVPIASVASRSFTVVEKSRELIGEFFEEEKENMHTKIKQLYERALISPRGLEIVNLSVCKLGETGAYHVANLISHMPGITVMKLWKSQIGPKGAEFLAEHIGKLTLLRVLALEENQLGTEGLSFLSGELPKLTQLQELYLHSNQMGVPGLNVLIKALKDMQGLHVLTLDDNDIRSEGVKLLLAEVDLTNMKTLGLSSNGIDDEGANCLAQKTQELSKLEKLAFDANLVSRDAQERLVLALKNTKVF